MFKRLYFCLITTSILLSANAEEWTDLLDRDLSNFEIWLGVPHTSIKGLPDKTYQSDNVHEGTPLGLNPDVKDVFSIIYEDDKPVLYISGEIYGGLTTHKEFENYHLSVQFKWGDKKWEPRLNDKRDSGILYHCHGDHGAFWKVWKSSMEFQVQETDLGDFIPLAGPTVKIRGKVINKSLNYDPESTTFLPRNGYINACVEPDAPHGEWNQFDLYVMRDAAIHVVNGQVVMVVQDARKKTGEPLTRGQIQIQSEAAECYYKNMKIRSIDDFPASIKPK